MALLVPQHPPRQLRPLQQTAASGRLVRRRFDLGDRISLEWLSDGGSVALDPDHVTEVTVTEVNGTAAAIEVPVMLSVCVELALLEQLLIAITGQPPTTPISFRTGTHPVTAPARAWLTKIRSLITSLEDDPSLAAAPWFQPQIEGWWIAAGLLYTHPHNHSHLMPAAIPHQLLEPRPRGSQSIGQLLSDRRRRLGLSQSELAELLTEASGTPITQGRVSDYEHERHIPADWLPHLSSVLDLPVDQLRRAAEQTRTLRRRQH